MPKIFCIAMLAGESGGRVALVRWCYGRERPAVGLAVPRRARERRRTVRLGNRRRRRLTLRRLAHWSRAQWRVVVELLRPLKRVLTEVASGQRLMHSHHLSLPFLYPIPFPLI